MIKSITRCLIAVVTVIMATSCTKGHKGTLPTYADTGKAVSGSVDSRFASLSQMYGQWNDVKIPLTLNLNSPAQASVGGAVTMVRDKDIYISLRFMGLEVMNLYATSDSVFGSFKPNKVYFAESIQSMMGNFPVTIGNVQDMLLGRAFVVGASSLVPLPADVRLKADGKGYSINPPAVSGVTYRFSVAPSNYVMALEVAPATPKAVTVNYKSNDLTAIGMVSPAATLNAVIGNTKIEASFEWNLQRASWNQGDVRSWQAPKGYKRVKALSLITSFSAI